MTWPAAFALTLAIELPIVWRGTRDQRLPPARRLAAGIGASALTHPALWFVLSPLLSPALGYWGFLALGEALVVAVEALWFWGWSLSRPLRLSLLANAASAAVGLLVWWLASIG